VKETEGRKGDVGGQANQRYWLHISPELYSLVIHIVCISFQWCYLYRDKLNPERGTAFQSRKSHLLLGYIVGNPFCGEVTNHVTSSTLKKASGLRVES
jgi:hypothetical protein